MTLKDFEMKGIRIAFFMLFLVVCALSWAQDDGFKAPSAPHLERHEVLQYFGNAKEIEFRNSFIGSDNNLFLTFTRPNRVELSFYGYAFENEVGTFDVDASGALHLQFIEVRHRFPPMHLYRSGVGAILYPIEIQEDLAVRGRSDTKSGASSKKIRKKLKNPLRDWVFPFVRI